MEKGSIRVNGRRLAASIQEMARLGGTSGGGMHRLTVTDEDRQARELFLTWLREIHLDVTIDEMGNIFGRKAGRNPDLPPVLTGSHLDTQPKGGRFDGILGVMGALETLRTLTEKGIETERAVTIVNWTNEEGTRFTPAMLGSGVWTGTFDRDWAYARTDVSGKTFGGELERIGYRGKEPARKWPVQAYYELHIEQGPVLERLGSTIGVPKGILGICWYDLEVEGKANQAGPTPMEDRKDALCAAAEMVLKANELPAKMGGNMVSTVGELYNSPNSRNIIPGRVRFTLDVRSWDYELMDRAIEDVKNDFRKISEKRGCPVAMDEIWRIRPTVFDASLVRTVEKKAELLGHAPHSMVSGAGHDAAYLARVCPTAMIFVPSIEGRSHVEVENTKWEDCEAGTNVLLQCVLDSAG
ncbi:MAG TPA: Zn-dependent hydrolase [Thermodesulfobacteriota bacterium]|nr:Zn-dependent hydrolase [Thermodesulfobacteriota bacterium]